MISITEYEKEGIKINEGRHFYVKKHRNFEGEKDVFKIYRARGPKANLEIARTWDRDVAKIILNELEKRRKYVLPNFLKKIIMAVEHSQMPDVEKYDLIREIRENKKRTDYIFHLLEENFIIF